MSATEMVRLFLQMTRLALFVIFHMGSIVLFTKFMKVQSQLPRVQARLREV